MTADLVRGALLTAIAYAVLAPLADRVHRALDDRRASLARHRRRVGGERRRPARRGSSFTRRPARAGSSSAGSRSDSSSSSRDDDRRAAALQLRRRSPSSRSGRASRSSCACSRFRARGTTRPCSATASGSASSRRCGCSRAAFTRPRVPGGAGARESLLQRASVSRVGRRRRARARRARRRDRRSASSDFARRCAGRSAASATGSCGPVGFRSARWRRSPSSGSARARLSVVGFFLARRTTSGHLGLRIWGLQHRLEARAARRVGARQSGAASWPAADRPAGGARHRHRDSACARPDHRPRAQSPRRRARRRRARRVRHRAPAGSHRRLAALARACSLLSSSSR